MSLFVNVVSQRSDSRNGASPAWDEEGWEPYNDLDSDDPDDRPSLLKEWATVFLTLVEVGFIVLMADRRR